MSQDDRIKKFNEYLNTIPLEKLHAEGDKQHKKDEQDFQELKTALAEGRCHYCNNPLSHFSEKKPCFHWLLKPNGFKKRHFPLLYEQKSFHQLEAYLRWVANCDKPMKNINDLVEEKSSSKFIEETIRYKNIEWSFSCSHGDRAGHKDKHEGQMPHYHFQMKVDGNVVINYNGFHLPFDDYDEFSFAVKADKFDRLKARHVQGAGMQAMFDHMSPEEIVDGMRHAENEEDAELDVGIMIQADEGTTISGDDIADMLEERKRTGVSMAKLVQRLKNVKVQTVISPGPGVPEIAARKRNRGKNQIEESEK
jgi:hypothetical protein